MLRDRGDAPDDGRDRLRRPDRDRRGRTRRGPDALHRGGGRPHGPRPRQGPGDRHRGRSTGGPNLVAHGQAGAIAVLAASEEGGLVHAPTRTWRRSASDRSPPARSISATLRREPRRIAEALGRRVNDITVVILERSDDEALIAEVRNTGARIKLIGDGDLLAAISCAVSGTGVHAVMGTGGAPEGVITAAAVRCLGGEIRRGFRYRSDDEHERGPGWATATRARLHHGGSARPGENLVFAATASRPATCCRVPFFGGGAGRIRW